MPQGYVDQGFRKKPTYSEILSSIERDEDKVELPERTALTFWDSFAMGQYKQMFETAAVGQQAQGERVQMDAAMTQAATDEGLNRQELVGFMRDMNTQNSAAHSTLAAQMQANIDATRRAAEAQAQSIAQEIATHTRKQDQRDEVVEQLRQSLAQAHQTPASVPIPPAPSTQELHTHYHAHQAALQPSIPQSSSTDPALAQLLLEGQRNSNARHNAQESYLQNLGMTLGNAVRHIQSNGAGLNSILHNLSQNRRGTTVEIPARSTNSPPPPAPAVGAIAIGGSSSSSVAAQLAVEMAGPIRKKERSASRSPRNRKPAVPAPDIPALPPIRPPAPHSPPAPTIAPKKKKKALVQIGSAKRRHSAPPDFPEESMPDHEPPMPPAPLPPPSEPPAAASTVAIRGVAQHMASVKKGKKKKHVTPDEALDRLLAEHERKKAKAAKRAVATQDRGNFAIRDQDIMDEEEIETQPPATLVAKKASTVKQAGFVTPSKKVAAPKKQIAGASGSQRRKKYLG